MHLGNVARHHQQLLIGIGHHANFQMPSGIEYQIDRSAKIARFQILCKFRVAQQVKNILPAIVRPAQSQNLLGQSVTPEDTAFFSGQHHRVG